MYKENAENDLFANINDCACVIGLCFYLFFKILIYDHAEFIAAHGLSLVAVIGGYFLVAVWRLLIVVASLIAEHGF